MRKQHPRGSAGNEYFKVIHAAGTKGITLKSLCAYFGNIKPTSVLVSFKSKTFTGSVVRAMPVPGRPSTLYAAEFAPSGEQLRQARVQSACIFKQREYEALVRKAGKSGITTEALKAHFGVSPATASQRLNHAEKAGLVVGVCGFVYGKSHRTKTWFAPEFVPSIVLPSKPKPVERVRSGWKADQTAIIPAGVKVQLCPPCQLDRFRVDPSIAGRGVISQDYFARRQA